MNWRIERLLHIAPALACAALAGACDDPLVEAQRIEGTRVLGARVEMRDEPERASPRPSERARVAWLVADPEPAPALGWALGVCVARPTTRGVPECAAAAFATFYSQGTSSSPPSIEFDTPDEAALGGAEKLLVSGAICRDSEPVLADILEQTRCAGPRTLVVLEIPIERSTANLNPRFADPALALDGRVWPSPAPDLLERADCKPADEAPELPLVRADHAHHAVAVSVDAAARDALPASEGQGLEELWVSSFSTEGRLSRSLSEIAAPNPTALLDWQAPGTVSNGQVARFYFVLRDLRGGSVWAVRSACVLP